MQSEIVKLLLEFEVACCNATAFACSRKEIHNRFNDRVLELQKQLIGKIEELEEIAWKYKELQK